MKFIAGTIGGMLLLGCLLAVTASAEYSQTTADLQSPSISADGTIIAFDSVCTNWAPGTSASIGKVFVYSRERHKVMDVGWNGVGGSANGDSYDARISADGRQVVYCSRANNLIGGANRITNDALNIFACAIEDNFGGTHLQGVHGRTGEPLLKHTLISVSTEGVQPNGWCEYPVCSSNARFVAFETDASNLAADDTNNELDVYLRDRDYDGNGIFDEEGAGKTRTIRVSQESDSSTPHYAMRPSISADGQYVAYYMRKLTPYILYAPIGVCVYSVANGTTVKYAPVAYTYEPRLSPDGNYMVVQSKLQGEESYKPTYSIMYRLPDTNWWYVPPTNNLDGDYAYNCEVSTGGQYVVYASFDNTNFVNNDTNGKLDVFISVSGPGGNNYMGTELVSKSSAGIIGNNASGGYSDYEHYAAVSWDGRYVAFVSAASNLVAVDTNGVVDIFIRDRLSNTTEIVAQKLGDPAFPAGAALTVSQVGDTSAFFQWTAATDAYPIWEYQLTLTNSGGSTQITVNGQSTSYSATGLTPGTEYTAELYAFDGGGGHSAALTASFTTTGQAPIIGPVITANSQEGNVNLNSGDPVTIAVQMKNIDPYLGTEVDWWIVAYASFGEWYYLNSSMQWTPFSGDLAFCQPVYRGALINLSSTSVLTDYILPVGTYNFWFAIDYPMDGILNLSGQILYDLVTVFVQ